MSRHRTLVAGLAAAVALTALTACSSSTKKTNDGGSGAKKDGGVYTSIDANNQITAGAPMNPFNAAPNSFLGYNQMRLGFDKFNPSDPNDLFPGLAASWTASDAGLTVQLQPNAKWSDGTPVTVADIKTSLAIAYTQGTAGRSRGPAARSCWAPTSRCRTSRTSAAARSRSTRCRGRRTSTSSGWCCRPRSSTTRSTAGCSRRTSGR
ncbi:ABC transporter substrate-binding protein [Catenulispora yoronensis]